MYFRLLLFAATFLASAAAYSSFSITAFAPGTSVAGAQLHAAHAGFFTGLSGPETQCDLPPPARCPPVEGTLVYEEMSGMKVAVPGGQLIYVQPDGQVKYTVPHSAYYPPGSIVNRFYTKKALSPASNCHAATRHDVVDFDDGAGHSGLALCPDIPGDMDGTGASFVLYAKTADFSLTDCVDIQGLTLTESEAEWGCWAYSG